MSKPLVSIAMPVRNCERTIATAVRSLVNQTFENWELIIIDDGSTDKTLIQLQRFQDGRIAVRHDGCSKGVSARLNEAIHTASGEYLARMDGDDVCYPHRLEWQLEYLRSHLDVDVVGGGMLIFGEDGRVIGKRTPPENHEQICQKPHSGFPMAHPTYFGKIGWFRRYGYREVAKRSQDQELLLRAYRTSRFANVPGIILGYREEQMVLGKILRSRRYFARALLMEHFQHGEPLVGLRGFLEQYLKAGVDLTAAATGLTHRLLSHRAKPVTNTDSDQWGLVWQMVGGGV